MSTLAPKEIKSYLSTLKEVFLDDTTSPNTLADAYLGILKIELLLRGILVKDDEKIWSQIQSSVGKALLAEQPSASKLPKALLAGANVLGGRVTEAFHTKLMASISRQVDQSVDKPKSLDFMKTLELVPVEKSSGARQRAEDLQDERWLLLLSPTPQFHNNSEIDIENYPKGILEVALGYYSTAASIQSDTPPMWKKVWDTWSAISLSSGDPNDRCPPFEAQVAIENLIRIALSKNNTKRASELQLRLAQSYLNPKRISLIEISSLVPIKQKKLISGRVAKFFGESSTHDLESDQDRIEQTITSIEKARSVLEAYESVTGKDIPAGLLCQALKVETIFAEENATVKIQAYKMNQRDKTSLTDCMVQCRSSLVLASFKNSDKILLEQVISLRDKMIFAWKSATTSIDGTEESDNLFCDIDTAKLCFQVVDKSIFRMKERAVVLDRKKSFSPGSWKELLQYMLPILNAIKNQITHYETTFSGGDQSISRADSIMNWLSGSLEENRSKIMDTDTRCEMTKLVETAVTMLPNVLWMVYGDNNMTVHPPHEELKLAVDVISALIKLQETAESRKQQVETPTIALKENDASMNISKLQQARASALCFLCQNDNSSIHRISSEAISDSKKQKKRGFLALLQCLVAWSGWFQCPWTNCTNLSDARRLLSDATADLSRPLTLVEGILLQLARADAEFLNGGFVQQAYDHYTDVLNKLQDEALPIDTCSTILLRAHCYNGMARVQNFNHEYEDYNNGEKSQSIKCLQMMDDLNLPPSIPPLWIWSLQTIFIASKARALAVTRQLIADSHLHSGRFEEARSFLQRVVDDSPLDANAALSLGAFLLRVIFYIDKEENVDRRKEAQIQLLKAAKLDPSVSDPFALLGIWYEIAGDLNRAKGCFRKSLKLDPCNPVAGRGFLRLCSVSDCQDILDSAVNQSSNLNGWAWNAVGRNIAYRDGNDTLAVVALLRALRCRDIAMPEKESFSLFYQIPSSLEDASEASVALAEVGLCYRRLGRMTASIRAFHASIEATDMNSISSTTLISCAQVEQDLGLFDEAAEKFARVIARGESGSHSVALYGHALAMFSIAERDLMDGKAGAAFTSIQHAIDSCENSSVTSACQFKLLGDLYSFGVSFPPDIFTTTESENQDSNFCFQNQLNFVAKAEDAYKSSLSAQAPFIITGNEESKAIKSSILCDIAHNILLQAQLMSSYQINTEKISNKYELAAEAFRDAIEYNPTHAASWCGLGCSVLKIDPLLAQHAFCRCIQIDNTFADAYANVGFLYTSRLAFNASKSTMEALTQVADTPMMWLNRAFVLEREAEMCLVKDEEKKTEDLIIQAADAYRASLQVMRHPEARLGLSLTGRVASALPISRIFAQKRRESFCFMNEYIGASYQKTGTASILQGIMSIELGESLLPSTSWKHEIVEKGRNATNMNIARASDISAAFDDPPSQNIITSTKTLLGERKTSLSTPKTCTKERNLQREIWLEPNRGDLWLSLAKLFIEKDAIESATRAATRAANILSQEYVASSQNNSTTLSFIDASLVSEALSLQCWLRATQEASIAPYNIQRALMMDPTNTVARCSLTCDGG